MSQDSLRNLWDTIGWNDLCIIGVPKGEMREKGTEDILKELIAVNFPSLGTEIEIQSKHPIGH